MFTPLPDDCLLKKKVKRKINETINKLEKLNLLNSKSYIQAFVNDKINLSSDGPYKIKKSLLEFDFNEEDIDNYLNTIDENIWLEKLKKIANKKKSIMKSKSYYMFVSKMKNDLYAHTIDIRSWISVKEAQELCQRLNVPFSKETVIKSVKIDGINQIKLKHNKAYIENKMIDRYGIEVQVNVGKLLKKSKVAMTVINNKTVTQMIKILNMVFAKEFGLNSKHSDAGSWNISRIDCGIDLKLCTDNSVILREYIRLLHDSFDVQNSKNITYSNYKTCKNWDDIRHESITLTSQGEATNEQRYKYNIYYKRQQLLAYAKENGIEYIYDTWGHPYKVDEIDVLL